MTQVRAFAKYAPAETRHTPNNLGLALTVWPVVHGSARV